jgi:hypothetical protein
MVNINTMKELQLTRKASSSKTALPFAKAFRRSKTPKVCAPFSVFHPRYVLSCRHVAMDEDDGPGASGLANFFKDPNLLGRLATNPRTKAHLSDPSFLQKIKFIQQNPRLADSMLSQDPRMIDVLGVLMGIDMQGFARKEGSDELPPGMTRTDPPPAPAASASSSPPPATSTPSSSKVEEAEDVAMEEEDDEEAKAKKEAEAEKAEGAKAYKAKNLKDAAVHFSKAWDLWPKDVTFLTNLGGKIILLDYILFVLKGFLRFSGLF